MVKSDKTYDIFIMQIAFYLFIFFAITNIHLQVGFLSILRLEIILWSTLLIGGIYGLIKNKKLINTKSIQYFNVTMFLGLSFISIGVLSSFSNNLNLTLFSNPEFKHLFKFLALMPFMYLFFRDCKDTTKLLDFTIICYFILSLVFFYRYLILNEVRDFDSRPTLNLRHGDPNFLATFFSMILPLIFWRLKNISPIKLKIFFSLFSICITLAVFMTQSRAGIIAMLSSFALILFSIKFSFSKRKLLLLCSGIILVLTFIFGQSLLKRYENFDDKSNIDRIRTYKNGITLTIDKPFLGVGFHQAKKYFFRNTGSFRLNSTTPPLEIHNTFLEVVAELGFAGLAIFLSMIFIPLAKILHNFRSSNLLRKELAIYSIASFLTLGLCVLVVGVAYKDLFIYHLHLIFLLNSKFSLEPAIKLFKAKG